MSMSYETLQLPLSPLETREAYMTRLLPLLEDADAEIEQPFAALVARVSAHAGPEGLLELAALLDAEGVTDVVAAQHGAADVFNLARRLLAARAAPPPRAAPAVASAPVRLLPNLARGPLTLLVMVVLLAALRYYESVLRRLGAPTWTTLLGLIVGMVIAGAIMQALGWRVSLALSQGTPRAVRPALLLGLGFGLGAALLAGLGLVVVGRAAHVPVAGLVGLGESCAGLAMLLILSGGLALLDRAWLAAVALAAAFGGTWLAALRWPAADPLLTQIVPGFAAALLLLGGLLAWTLHRRTRGGWSDVRGYLPSPGQLVYRAAPYLAYGALAVIYVLVGQASGWLAPIPAGWTRAQVVTAVEMVHLISLAALVLNQGVAEYALRSFWPAMEPVQAQVAPSEGASTRAAMIRFLRRATRMLLIGQAAVALALAALALWLWRAPDLAGVFGPLVPHMLFVSLFGYGLLAWGLFGCGFLVMLGRAGEAVRALLIATLVQVAGSLVVAQIGAFALATAGSVAGGASLVLVSQSAIARLLRQSDYALYQAF